MGCAFIWYAHAAPARKAGVRDDVVDNIREKRAAANLDPEEQTVVDFTRELLQHRKVSRRGQSKYTQRQGINVLAPAPIEALSDYFIAPNMLTAQRACCLRADQFMPLDNFCEKFDS